MTASLSAPHHLVFQRVISLAAAQRAVQLSRIAAGRGRAAAGVGARVAPLLQAAAVLGPSTMQAYRARDSLKYATGAREKRPPQRT